MQASTEQTIRTTYQASQAGSIHFGQVVADLVAAGVESYHVDYRAARTTYFLAEGGHLALEGEPPAAPIAQAFSAEGLQAAIRGAQRGEVMYPEFQRLSQQAGCVAYTVWLAGRHVSYHGRRGETHLERFPAR